MWAGDHVAARAWAGYSISEDYIIKGRTQLNHVAITFALTETRAHAARVFAAAPAKHDAAVGAKDPRHGAVLHLAASCTSYAITQTSL